MSVGRRPIRPVLASELAQENERLRVDNERLAMEHELLRDKLRRAELMILAQTKLIEVLGGRAHAQD